MSEKKNQKPTELLSELAKLIQEAKSAKKEQEDMEAEQARQMQQRIQQAREEKPAVVTMFQFDTGKSGCNPTMNVCVKWERPDGDTLQEKGKGTAFRWSEDHYAEVKTQGYDSNTSISITHDDNPATALIGSGDPGGNVVVIKQNTGVLKVK